MKLEKYFFGNGSVAKKKKVAAGNDCFYVISEDKFYFFISKYKFGKLFVITAVLTGAAYILITGRIGGAIMGGLIGFVGGLSEVIAKKIKMSLAKKPKISNLPKELPIKIKKKITHFNNNIIISREAILKVRKKGNAFDIILKGKKGFEVAVKMRDSDKIMKFFKVANWIF